MRYKLHVEEQRIADEAEFYLPLSTMKQQKVEGIIDQSRKSRLVTIRIAENVHEELKRRSEREGIPYQMLISSILYKYSTDRLIDEEAIQKSVRLQRE